MKKYLNYFKNKYIFTTTLFVVYILFLDDVDIFSIARQNKKLSELELSKTEISKNLKQTRSTLSKLDRISEVERFAREEKLFKKDNEDVFVISYE